MPLRITLDELERKRRVERDAVLPLDCCAGLLGGGWTAMGEGFPVHVDVRRASQVVEATVRVQGRFAFACSRCAEPLELVADLTFEHRFMRPGSLDAGDLTPEEAAFNADPELSEHDDVAIDLQGLCVEYLLLELPYAPGCPDASTGECARWNEPWQPWDPPPEADDDPDSPWSALRDVDLEKS